MTDPSLVVLRPAWVWTCTTCGRDNWRHAEAYEVNSRVLRQPKTVLCLTCGEVYEVVKEERRTQ